jgi:hypothetical protein
MNPEFERNLWLEATPLRLGLMAGFLLLAFLAAGAIPGLSDSAGAASVLYYFIVVLWGTRNAALGVVGEIRERTWDAQKLSSLEPSTMMWGKLFGATCYNWFGGLICLPFVLWPVFRDHGAIAMAQQALVLLMLGVQAQAVSLLASLNLVRRQNNNWRLDTFLCQVAGIVVAGAYWGVLQGESRLLGTNYWWGWTLDARDFHIVSLCLFTAWALMGCYRAMRVELRFENGPFVWLGWLLFLSVYAAGFETWLESRSLQSLASEMGFASQATLYRLLIVTATLAACAYGMVLVEVKDPVRPRWLVEKLGQGRFLAAFLRLDAWMLSYAATLAVGLVLVARLFVDPGMTGEMLVAAQGWTVLAMLGFLSRDVALFLVMRSWSRNRGDLGALALLAALYVLAPIIAGHTPLALLFRPDWEHPGPLSPALAWIEAAGVAVLAMQRLRLARKADNA